MQNAGLSLQSSNSSRHCITRVNKQWRLRRGSVPGPGVRAAGGACGRQPGAVLGQPAQRGGHARLCARPSSVICNAQAMRLLAKRFSSFPSPRCSQGLVLPCNATTASNMVIWWGLSHARGMDRRQGSGCQLYQERCTSLAPSGPTEQKVSAPISDTSRQSPGRGALCCEQLQLCSP